MRLPNLLASRRGRLAAFFLLYTTEGVPLGFAATAVATQLRRMGVGPAEIGAFVAAFYLPWAFKWAFGPMIDVFRSQRFGHRRGWILLTQAVMAATILALLAVPLPQGLTLFTGILLVHNTFAAMQDVAIDALACNTLAEGERGLANGLMFAGASLGQALGGAGVLFIADFAGFTSGFVLVAAAILAVSAFVVLPMKEALLAPAAAGGGWRAATDEMRSFAELAFRSFLGSRAAFAGVFFALLPSGAMSLSLALQTNLAVELGMKDDEVAWLALLSTVTSAGCMVAGGLISDRLGRRRTLAVYIALMSVPVAWMAWVLHSAGYVMPRTPGAAPLPELIASLWIATLSFNVGLGLMYGTRTAVFMDITNPRVAGTQFTAYMAMMNLAIAFAATWQGVAIEAFGYPLTLLLDAAAGLLCLLLLPLLAHAPGADAALSDRHAEGRARATALALALLCTVFAAWWLLHERGSVAVGLLNTLFTLVFVASALVLYASSLLQSLAPGWQRACRMAALAVLLLYLRRYIEPGAAAPLWQGLVAIVAMATAALLVRVASAPWSRLNA